MLRFRNYAHGSLVAGAAAEGNGILVGWQGEGDITRTRLVALATQAGIPLGWLPSPKDPAVQLTRAVRAVAGGLYNCERAKKMHARVGEREWSSRWSLVRRVDDAGMMPVAGEKFGTIVLVVTLYVTRDADGERSAELDFDAPDPALIASVRAEYDTRIGAERYVASDITRWLAETIRYYLDGVRYGGNWYVPRQHRMLAEAICQTFQAAGWGRSWMSPPLPIATSDQLARGVANGLQGEVGDVVGEIAHLRDLAKADGKVDIGERAATSAMIRLRGIGERIVAYADMLGETLVEECRFTIHDAMVDLDGVLGAHDFEREWSEVATARAQREAQAAA
jgi:hypothetical protein